MPLTSWIRKIATSKHSSFCPLMLFSTKPKIRFSEQTNLHQFLSPHQKILEANLEESVPYVNAKAINGNGRKFIMETYGCQMNFSDAEVVRSILLSGDFRETKRLEEADIILVLTCAIREGAERKIWARLGHLKRLKAVKRSAEKGPVQIGILGCMAERLRTSIIEREPMVDVIAGPDSYQDLPRLLYSAVNSGRTAVNVLLSLDETYASINPVRANPDAKTAFVSVMRGCDNMCSFCIVPFTRGRERSRPIDSILEEIARLVDSGVKEVTLLGQNVNSYRDVSESCIGELDYSRSTNLSSAGFSTVYRPKVGGRRFCDLLDRISIQWGNKLRIRFTSPHPKDFPQEVLQLIKERQNICRQIHLPAQSGNNEILRSMGRNYTREAYLELVEKMREVVPGLALTSDFIAGFCGESEEAHAESVALIHQVKFSFAYCFPYSMRAKTRAFHRLVDDVPSAVKQRRANELISAFRHESLVFNRSMIGSSQLVLIEGVSKRSPTDWAGRCDAGVKVILPNQTVPVEGTTTSKSLEPGDYVTCQILDASSQVLKGQAKNVTTLASFGRRNNTEIGDR